MWARQGIWLKYPKFKKDKRLISWYHEKDKIKSRGKFKNKWFETAEIRFRQPYKSSISE